MKKPILWVVIALAVVAVAAVLLWPKPAAPPPPPPPPQAQAAPPGPADIPLPPSETSDQLMRKVLGNVSPLIAKWLQQDNLLDRTVVVADNLAEGVSPRKQLPFLAPAKPFSAPKNVLDERSYKRYDAFADAIASIDAKTLAAAVRELRPLLESAYHKLGYPDRTFDSVATRALQRLVDAPVVEGPIPLTPKGAIWRYSADELESLGPVEKHLLRMGPRNTKLIQIKSREVASALDLRLAAH
ncbi:MAG: DUF3014 domain-containing protein [Myxococcales bacterium]|nr:DUF3014 domain-containing protein [Myxococcales bacterium]